MDGECGKINRVSTINCKNGAKKKSSPIPVKRGDEKQPEEKERDFVNKSGVYQKVQKTAAIKEKKHQVGRTTSDQLIAERSKSQQRMEKPKRGGPR